MRIGEELVPGACGCGRWSVHRQILAPLQVFEEQKYTSSDCFTSQHVCLVVFASHVWGVSANSRSDPGWRSHHARETET